MVTFKENVPRRTKAGYGTAELGMSAAEVVLQIYLLLFYTQQVGLTTELAGYALGLAVLWDAITDPIMGFVSDRTRTRWGKRRPWMALGAFVLAGAFIGLFHPPALDSQTAKFLYLLVLYMAVNTGMTLISIPHTALGGELSMNRHERNEIFGWRMLCKYGGFIIAVVMLGVTAGDPADGLDGGNAGLAALGIGLVVVLSGFFSIFMTRNRDSPAQRTPEQGRGLLAGVKAFLLANLDALRNPVFAPLILAFVVAQAGRTINSSIALQYYTVRLGFSQEQVLLGILVPFMLFASPSILAWVLLARRYGKKRPAFWGALLLGIQTIFLYPLLPPGELWAAVVFSAGVGGFFVSSVLLFDSLVADIVDYDELRSGQHREGLYFGCWLLATKVARAIGLAATGQMLGAIGYQEGATEQAPEVGWRLAMLFGPVVGGCFVAAALIFLLMPLTDAKHKQVQRLLAKRHNRQRALSEEASA